jgi:DNA modification methylase
VEGCAVAELDQQSGINTNTVNYSYARSGEGFIGSIPNQAEKATWWSETGGASRYFKQVGDFIMSTDIPQDLIDYLHTLITPTHVGGETLIALDIGAVDWASILDGKYSGVIARGEPTEEQTEHMWRVVKPGAHVLLIAPDSCPTGHRGACALEDRGFEIRDAILWVREAGKLHYVPKANTKERNAGCAGLAVKRKGPPTYELTEETLADEELIGSIMEALQTAGVAEDVVDSLVESGLPKDLVPAEYKRAFQKRVGGGKYGNNHPTCKPIEVMARVMQDVPSDALVMDPFMGSGTTALACLETRHSFIGIEREPDYIEIADARVRHWQGTVRGWLETTVESEAPQTAKVEAVDEGGLFDLFD